MRTLKQRTMLLISISFLLLCSLSTKADESFVLRSDNEPKQASIRLYNNSHFTMKHESTIVENATHYWYSDIDPYHSTSGYIAPRNRLVDWMTARIKYFLTYGGAQVGQCTIFMEIHIRNPIIYDIQCTVTAPHQIYTEKHYKRDENFELLDFALSHRNIKK